MLTGDKLGTAENIARSCNLILPHFEVLKVAERAPDHVKSTLQAVKSRYQILSAKNKPKALLVEGEALSISSHSAVQSTHTLFLRRDI